MNLLNLEDEKFKDVKVKGHKFKIRFMSPLDRMQITQQRVNLQNGNPVTSLTESDFIFFENIAIVNICTDDMPDDFDQNESCICWDDLELINGLATEIRKHTSNIEAKLKKNKPVVGGEQG